MKKTRQKNLRLKNKKDQSRTIFFCLIFFWLMAATMRSPAARQVLSANHQQSETTVQLKQESEFDEKRREEASKNPQDISFTIRLAGDKKQFRQGEVLALEMRFASGNAKTYKMNAAA